VQAVAKNTSATTRLTVAVLDPQPLGTGKAKKSFPAALR
jgi:hypothetical protein